MSALEKSGIEQIYNYLKEGKTVVFLGSSGTGKSTIINCLLDAPKQATNSLRDNDKGSHTKEPGCAIKEALEEGNLEPERLESYFKQKRELNRLSEKTELAKKKLMNMRKRKSKELSKLIRMRNKLQDKIQYNEE